MKLTEYVEYMLERTGLKAQFEYDLSEEGKTRHENLMEFIGAAREFEEKSPDSSLEAFLENVALVTDLDRQEDAAQFVTLMTLHSAKGLEYDAVFLAGLEEGIFPSLRNLADEKRLEEERRLCYVGITRARKRLFLSFARRRMLFNQITHNAPSCFIKEIPSRLISDEWTDERRKSFAPENQPRREQMRRGDGNRVISFGTPGMNQGALNIPGVSKGFVPSPARAVSAAAKLFSKGDRVLHRKFGEGTVVDIFGEGADTRISISFTAYGVKVFALAIAPIIKIEE